MTDTDVSIRLAVREDVHALLELLPQITSRPDSLTARTLDVEASTRIFDQMCSHGNVYVVVGDIGGQLVAALTIAVVPNLTYEGRPWSIIENVVVDRGQRGRGVGKRLMAFAFDLAEQKGCYKVQVLSGPNDDQVGFYRSTEMVDGTSRGFKKHFVDKRSVALD